MTSTTKAAVPSSMPRLKRRRGQSLVRSEQAARPFIEECLGRLVAVVEVGDVDPMRRLPPCRRMGSNPI